MLLLCGEIFPVFVDSDSVFSFMLMQVSTHLESRGKYRKLGNEGSMKIEELREGRNICCKRYCVVIDCVFVVE